MFGVIGGLDFYKNVALNTKRLTLLLIHFINGKIINTTAKWIFIGCVSSLKPYSTMPLLVVCCQCNMWLNDRRAHHQKLFNLVSSPSFLVFINTVVFFNNKLIQQKLLLLLNITLVYASFNTSCCTITTEQKPKLIHKNFNYLLVPNIVCQLFHG